MDMILGPFFIALVVVGLTAVARAYRAAWRDNGPVAATIGLVIFAAILWVLGALIGFGLLALMWGS